jgi:hypothetical protein
MLTLSSVPAEEAAPFYKDFLAAFSDGHHDSTISSRLALDGFYGLFRDDARGCERAARLISESSSRHSKCSTPRR